MQKLQLNIFFIINFFKLKYDFSKKLTIFVINFNKFLSIFFVKKLLILNKNTS